uniref:NB-ARC domain-containing protein n=1 Tax=Leersia perrieri TaxID=77586 RepID=A0A0D9V081_9ORYZ
MSSMDALLVKLAAMEELDVQRKDWRDKVRELSFDMEDCIDIFMHKVGDADAKSGLMQRLKMLKARYKIANLMKQLKARAVEISNCRDRYWLDEPGRSGVVPIDPRMQAIYAETNSLVGIDGPREKIIEWLLEEGAQQVKVTSIVGFGGVGKTTLANQVYNKIKGKFECTAFVSVSRNPNIIKILSDLVVGVRGRMYSSRKYDERQLIDIVRAKLKDKRYLLVIDDIWAVEAWGILKCCFVENDRGSGVITTTRMEDIANACCSGFHGYVYKMEPLNDLDSRRLFHRRIFHSEDACPEQLKNASDDILKKCRGVPLAILTIASILASHEAVDSMEIWEKIKHCLGFYLETNPALEWMRHVLSLGYNDLSMDLKTCMLYLGIFPEDSEIRKNDLLRRWTAEGFITKKHCIGQDDVAESYFNELINRNMIQIAEFDDCGEILSCRLHDLLLDFIILKSTAENFITLINDHVCTECPWKVRRLSVHVRDSESKHRHLLTNMALTQARSFNLWGPAQWLPPLSKFQLLRVLHLEIYGSTGKRYDTSCICSLFQLRYLRTSGIVCKKLLTQLLKLEHLQTLEVTCELPEYIELDVCWLPLTLQHLIVHGSVNVVGGIGRMRALYTIDLDDADSLKGLGELINLRELKLVRSCYGEEDGCYFLLSSLCRLLSLQSLIINGYLYEEDVLTRWSPTPRNLRRLHVLECLFSTIPSDWITQLDKLRSLEIQVVSFPRDGADVLARLSSLVHLTLHVKKNAPEEGVVVHSATFPNLMEFCFRFEVPCLVFEAGAMPRLRSLNIDCYAQGARRADGVLDGIEHLGGLLDFKVCIYKRGDFLPARFKSGYFETPHAKAARKWDSDSLMAAVTEAINKHPGSPRIIISTV